MLIWLTENLVLLAVCLAAIRFGGRPERHGGIWFLCTASFQVLITGAHIGSTTLYLLVDGIYATGLIPLAFFHVSWWIGIMAFLVCASFSLQALYMVTDTPSDVHFVWLGNVVVAIQLVTILGATIASYVHRHRKVPAKSPA